MSPSFNASQTKLCAWTTSTLDDNFSLEHIPEQTDDALHNSNDHIQILLKVLLEPSPAKLPSLLKSLGAEHNNDEDYHHLAETIARMAISNLPPTLASGSKWMLPIATDEMNASAIADTIVTEVFSALHKVPFSALAQAACQHQSQAITKFFRELKAICWEIRRHIEETGEPNDKYEASLRLVPGNPLASWVLSQAISKSWPPEKQPDLSFILLPIRGLFAGREVPFTAKLKRLQFLAILYEEKIGNYETFTWIDFTLLEHISSKDPMEVAKVFTDADAFRFRFLCDADFIDSSPRLREISSRWSDLASAVKACCVVYSKSNVVGVLSEVSKCLIDHRNYYSGLAFLTGIQNAGFCPENLLTDLEYIDTSANYTFYMKKWSERPGLPFLLPHIIRLRGSQQDTTSRPELLSEVLKCKSYEDDDFNVRRLLSKFCHQSFALAIFALHSATQYLIGWLPSLDKSRLEDIEKGPRDMAKSTEDENVMNSKQVHWVWVYKLALQKQT
ncbi:hypothetical protein V490_03311 [Pseudogymnoascus sp. VKM F-3557]|nr:hypothetical protein V490_03311 [Pseudogymnoascus sp. VKM F-3557]